MIKQKAGSVLAMFLFFLAGAMLSENVKAAGSATVSWTPPTTDQGGGALTGLAGYKVFYSTTSNWANQTGTCSVEQGNVVDVPGGEKTSYHFPNNLIPGQTYYFAVAAYDEASTPNVSKCATGAGAVTEVSKVVSYSGDISPVADHRVNINDYTVLADYYHQAVCGPENKADINRDCHVDINDFTILADDYGKSF